MPALPSLSSPELDQRIKALAKPGTVFGEPYREAGYTIITASRVKASPGRLVANPIGAILISSKGVELRRFSHPAARVLTLLFLAAIIFWSGMLLNPPWKPDTSLLQQVRELIATVREKSAA